MAKVKNEEGKNYVWVELNSPSSKQITNEEEKTILAQAQKKYGGANGKLKFSIKSFGFDGGGNQDEALNADTINDIHDPKFQLELFKRYIAENNIQDYNWDKIVDIDSRINSLIDYDSYEKGRRFSLNYARWKNFLSFGPDNYFDFSKLKGLTLLKGEPANKSGKSTFAYDLLHFGLYGKTRSGKAAKNEEMFNNYLPDERELVVEIGITLDGEKYIIRRTLTKPDPKKKTKTISNTVEYYHVNENGTTEKLLDVDNLAGDSSTKTTKAIKEAIGNEEDFDRIISANAKDLDELISMKDTDRGRVLARRIGLLPIEDKELRAKEMWARESSNRLCDSLNREAIKDEIETIKSTIAEYRAKIESNKEKIVETKEILTQEQHKRDELLSSKSNIDKSLLNVDVATVEKTLSDIIENGKKAAAKKKALEDEIKGYGEIEYSEDEYKSYQNEKETLIGEMGSLRSQIKSMHQHVKSLKDGEVCPTCGKKWDGVDNSQAIADTLKKIEEATNLGIKYKERCQELDGLISTIDTKRNQYIEKNQKEIKVQALAVEITNLRNKYTETKGIKDTYQKNKDAIIRNNEIDVKINIAKANIDTYDGIIRNLENENVALGKDIETNELAVRQNEANIKVIENEIETEKNWKLYLQMIGKDGIGKMVLKSTLPKINGALDNLLDDVADFKVEVEVNNKNDVEFWLVRDGVKTRLSAGSGLERTMSALALRVVLGKMSNLTKPPFIVLDEILGSVAKENYEDMRKLYEKIEQEYVYILHICHIDLDWHRGTITIVKENNISKVIQEH